MVDLYRRELAKKNSEEILSEIEEEEVKNQSEMLPPIVKLVDSAEVEHRIKSEKFQSQQAKIS